MNVERVVTLEHGALRCLPNINTDKGGIFSLPLQDRMQFKHDIQWVAAMCEVPSISILGKILHEGIKPRQDEDWSPETQNLWAVSRGLNTANAQDCLQRGNDPGLDNNYLTQLRQKFTRNWVESHGIDYDEHIVDEAFQTAEGIHDYLAKQIFGANILTIAAKNEVEHERDPLTLLCIALNDMDSRKRFEAARKLYLSDIALIAKKVRKREKEQMQKLYDLFNSHVFSPPEYDSRTGGINPSQTTETYFLTYHATDDFRVTFIRPIEPDEKIDESLLTPDMRIQPMSMRTWYDFEGKPHKVLIEPRVKNAVSFVIKMLRNDTLYPQELLDTLGTKLTFETESEIELFRKTLLKRVPGVGPQIADVKVTIVSDSDSRVKYQGEHKASSEKLEIVKYHIEIGGVIYEFQNNTIRTYVDAQLRDGVAWEDYDIIRLITPDKEGQPSLVDLLYPQKIYGSSIHLHSVAQNLLAANRVRRREKYTQVPEQFRRKGRDTRIMTTVELDQIISNIATRLLSANKIPDYVVIAEGGGKRLHSTVVQLANLLGIPIEHIVTQNALSKIPKDKRILIFDDVYRAAKHINIIKSKLGKRKHPKALIDTAALVVDSSVSDSVRNRLFYDHTSQPINTEKFRIVFPFEAKFRIYKNSVVYLISQTQNPDQVIFKRSDSYLSADNPSLLVEVLPDGSYKLPGGTIDGEENQPETPREAVLRELREELAVESDEVILHPEKHPYVTPFEPHPNLDKPHYSFSQHHVFLVQAESIITGERKLPQNFQFVPIEQIKHRLRWLGQKILWNQLQEEGILPKSKYDKKQRRT